LPADNIRQRTAPFALYAIGAAGALVNLFRSLHANPLDGTLFVAPYWVSFFLSNYQDGFHRRALMGTLCRILFPAGVSILLINLFAFAVLLAVIALLLRALCRLSHPEPSPRARLFFFALCASTLTAAFYETLGDLLQLTLVLLCAVSVFLRRSIRGEHLKLLACLAVIVLSFLLHEASIFLLAPALPFFLKQRPRPRDFVLPLCLAAALTALSVYWSAHSLPHPTYFADLGQHRTQPATTAAAPALHWELAAEYRAYFATPAARLYFAGRFPRILALAFAYLIALSHWLPRRTLQRTVYALASVLLVSMPLWCIAIDWGRFLTCAVFLALFSSTLWPVTPTQDDLPGPIVRLTARLEALAANELLQYGALLVLLTGPEAFATHIEGISPQDAGCFCVLAIAALLMRLSPKPSRM
jgi:hypothetical protein